MDLDLVEVVRRPEEPPRDVLVEFRDVPGVQVVEAIEVDELLLGGVFVHHRPDQFLDFAGEVRADFDSLGAAETGSADGE